MRAFVLITATLGVLTSPTLADTSVNLGLTLAGDAEIKTVAYTCEGHDPITVQYVNAAPNFLAVLPIEGRQTVFVNVLTASGAKYVSGQYEWWNKGTDVTLHDVTEGLDAAPVLMCSEDIQTP